MIIASFLFAAVKEVSMSNYVSKDMINKAMNVNLLEYAKSLGMEFESRGSSDTLYWKGHSLNITQSKNMYYRFSSNTGGNVINFAMEMEGLSFPEAIRKLCGEEIQKNYQSSTPMTVNGSIPSVQQSKERMILPKANPKANRVFAYLVRTRKIDPEIVSQMMREHKIYENDKHSCVFVGYDEKGKPGYANVRSTNTDGKAYRGEVKNSDKRFGFTMRGLPKSNSVYVFEAPIDAMSHASLMKMAGGDWQEDWRISLGGTSDLALQQFLKTHPWIKNIHFATDNDLQGNKVLENEYNEDGTIKKAGYLKKYKDLGYETYREEPLNKDFNKDLEVCVKQLEEMEQGQIMDTAGVEI